MTEHNDYSIELDGVDQKDLAKASRGLWNYDAGETRYGFYRRRGYNKADALAYALAWCRNAVEQAERRKSHDTGCGIAV